MCQGIRPEFQVNNFRYRPHASFIMPRSNAGVCRPKALSLPASVRIIDPAIDSARVETQRIGNAELQELLFLGQKCDHRIRIRSRGKRHVSAEPERIEYINPVQIVVVRVDWIVDVFELRAW